MTTTVNPAIIPSDFNVVNDWWIQGVFTIPSAVLGLVLNTITIILSRKDKTYGRLSLIINLLNWHNLLQSAIRCLVLLYFFVNFLTPQLTSLTGCTLIATVFMSWIPTFIVFDVTLLGAFQLLSILFGEIFLKKHVLFLGFGIASIIPAVAVLGRLINLLARKEAISHSMCRFRYVDDCNWCSDMVVLAEYASYSMAVLVCLPLGYRLLLRWRTSRVSAISPPTAILSDALKHSTDLPKSSTTMMRRLSAFAFGISLEDEVRLLIFVFLQAVIPLVLSIPGILAPILESISTDPILSAFVSTIYNYNTVTDAILVLVLLRPYNRACRDLCRRRKTNEDASVSQIKPQAMIINEPPSEPGNSGTQPVPKPITDADLCLL